jgi:SMC interacting uncharacterized protein involved in chromosome segregation
VIATSRVDPIEFIDRLLSEARDKAVKLHSALMHENRKLANQLEDARDAIAERDARIRELEEKLTNAGDHR